MLVCNAAKIKNLVSRVVVMKIYHKIALLLSFMIVGQTYCPTVGSNSTASRQLKPFFPAAQVNIMQGFSVFEQGLVLENAATTCTFDAFFPLSGTLTLNDGAILLARDLAFKNPLKIGSGTIKGNGYSVEFPNNISLLALPSDGHARSLNLESSATLLAQVNSVDWSYDNKYLAVALSTATNAVELQIYYLESMTLTLTAQHDLGARDVYTVNWHPSAYYLATGQLNDQQLRVFEYAPSGSLTQKSNATIGTINAVSWHPTGNYLAVGRNAATDIRIYGVTAGVLDSTYIGTTFSVARSVQRNALDWHPTGTYLVAGFDAHASDTECKIFAFNGAQLNLYTQLELGATVAAVRWHPNQPLVALGLSAGAQRVIVYDFSTTVTAMTQKAVTGETSKIMYTVDWSPDGNYLATGRQSVTDNLELQIYKLYPNYSFEMVSGYELAANLLAFKWSHDGRFLATGDSLKKLNLFSFLDKPLIFENTRVFLGSDVIFKSPVHFKGVCTLNGGGNILDFDQTASLVVMPGASLTIEQAIIKGIAGNKIQCQDNAGVITLRNVRWIQEDDAYFDQGALVWQNEVIMEGDAEFTYSSSKTSTLLPKSNLRLDVGFTFSYDPGSPSKQLIEFVDATSKLILNGATLHATVTGMDLRKGKILVERDSFLSSEKSFSADNAVIDEGIVFGNNSSSDDCVTEILSGVTLHVKSGSIAYKNVNTASWSMLTDTSVLKMWPETTCNLYQMLNLGSGTVSFGNNSTLCRATGKKIIGSVNMLGYVAFTNLSGS
jgi:WD40 repeat protein